VNITDMNKNIAIKIALGVLILAVFWLVGKVNQEEPTNTEATNIKQYVQDLSTRHVKAESASINSRQLIVTSSAGSSKTYDLPDEEFFVSIAPFVNTTHPCATHSLTGCQGELANAKLDVYIEDQQGNAIVNGSMTTMDNGFLDLWLPRNQKYNITIQHDGKTAKSEFSTFDKDNTCITTIRLS
jgi:hypothetical protein